MTEHFNKWKKYNKSWESRNIVKYFTASETVNEALKKYSKKNGVSMAKIIEDAIKQYLKIK